MQEAHHEHHEHLGHSNQWSVYEANVQSYRNMALASQSLYLAVGAILMPYHDFRLAFLTVFVFSMITQWFIWFPVIFSRTAIVDYHKFNLGKRFNSDGGLKARSTEPDLLDREYARTTNWSLRAKVYSELKLANGERFRTIRVSRTKIDLLLPIFITIVWAVFVAAVFTIN